MTSSGGGAAATASDRTLVCPGDIFSHAWTDPELKDFGPLMNWTVTVDRINACVDVFW